ncbi:MAG: PSD1 and planctomycete cytochrome C domain-containing protein [Akkermansiaceae bacterium]
MRRIYTFILLLSQPVSLMALEQESIKTEQLEFFEEKIRPVLIESCYKCHSEESEKLKGSLLLDSKAGWMKGGDTGQVIIPGDADNSLFMQMIHHEPGYEAMPPKSKLSDAHLANFKKWIDDGAYDPRDREIGQITNIDTFNLEERKQWWSFQPIKKYDPPHVVDSSWTNNEYDNFILAALDKKGWKPAPPASKENLLRRLSFDLIGLAPTEQELESFLSDSSDDAYAKQVDRLLASPQYGEKWARHWMDAVRYAESKSFEFDYVMSHAHQYRNYLIEMFNEDVPYDDFIRESFAGDLIPNPRLSKSDSSSPQIATNESIKGPGFLYLTDGQHGPPDLHEDEARAFSGIIDTTSKAFLGITIACARCHDHKFDAITTADYYSWYGILKSSRLDIANTVALHAQTIPSSKLKELKPAIFEAALKDAAADIKNIDPYIDATKKIIQSPEFVQFKAKYSSDIKPKRKNTRAARAAAEKKSAELEKLTTRFATATELDPVTLKSWLTFSMNEAAANKWPQLQAIYETLSHRTDSPPIKNEKNAIKESAIKPYYEADLSQWIASGSAFQEFSPAKDSDLVLSLSNSTHIAQTLVSLENPTSGLHSGKITGSLRSPDFILDGTPVELYAKGKKARIKLIIRNYEQAGRGPTTKILNVSVNQDSWQKISIQTKLWKGHPAYLEVIHHGDAIELNSELNDSADDSYLSISTSETHPNSNYQWIENDSIPTNLQQIWKKVYKHEASAAEISVLSALFETGLVRAGEDRNKNLKSLMTEYRAIHEKIPQPSYARSLTEGTPQDEPVYVRGNHKSLSSEPNPRRFLDALGGKAFTPNESGRRELSEALIDPTNPLVSRVMVNRLWHHIFGQGLVSTINDFGKLGTMPSHPKLLDYLAQDFMQNEWSIKSMIRKMVMSSTYQMGSVPNEQALELDPNNQYLQRMPIKRLEAEQIRDHILFCSRQLNLQMYGPSIQAFTEDLPKARGHKGSGPVDSDGRRSVYIELRRNFMPSFLRVWGMPNGLEPIGARNITNVPAQSLSLMNSEFLLQQSEAWAKHVLENQETARSRIQAMHLRAFGRAATPDEITWAESFIDEITTMYQSQNETVSELNIWQELCHLMMNRKEFIYLN